MAKYAIGDVVDQKKGHTGVIVAIFTTNDGELRYAVDSEGALAFGVVRCWTSFSQIATEVENARIWRGIHYRSAVEHGTPVGRQIGEYAVKSAMRPLVN